MVCEVGGDFGKRSDFVAHFIAVDAAGNVFTAEAQLRGVTKYVRD